MVLWYWVRLRHTMIIIVNIAGNDEVQEAQRERQLATQQADVIVKAEIAKRELELQAEAEAEQMRPDSSYVTVTLAIQNGADISKYHFDFAGTDYETHKVREKNEFGQFLTAVLVPFSIDLATTLLVMWAVFSL